MANKKAFQGSPLAVQVRPRPRPVIPPPYPERAPKEIHYPSSDGKPMADNSWQARTMSGQYGTLSTRYADAPNVFVGIDLMLYYTEGNPDDVVVPDVFVAFGVPNRDREIYKVWEEGKVPDFVLEVASKSTYRKDLGSKKDTYERMGVREYCVFDPRGGMHWPRLQLFRLDGSVYKPVPSEGNPHGPLAVTSETLGVELRFEDERLRLWDLEGHEYLLEQREERAGRLKERAGRLKERAGRIAADQRAERAERRGQELEVEVARLKDLLRRRT